MRWTGFWFSAIDPVGLHRLRVLAGLLFLSWLLPLTSQQDALFGLNGWLDKRALVEASELPGGAPAPIGVWSLVYACGDATLLHVFWWAAIAVILLFTLGVCTRLTSVLTWVVIVSFLAIPTARGDADFLLGILAFYLMIGYLLLGLWNGNLSPAGMLLGGRDNFLSGLRWTRDGQGTPSYAANLAIRLLQIHFAIIVVTCGLHKLQFGDWWSGVALWYPLHQPFAMTAERLRAEAGHVELTLIVVGLVQYLVLAWQIAFPMFAWRRAWRPVLVGGGVLGWAGVLYVYGLPLFGPVFLIGCLSYLTPAEWHGITDRLLRAFRRPTASTKAALDPKVAVRLGARS
jgi:hypothetical protein